MPDENSDAAKFNRQVLQKLQKVLQEDPEADLLARIPNNYTARLENRKAKRVVVEDAKPSHLNSSPKRTRDGSKRSKFAMVDMEGDVSSALEIDATLTVLDPPRPDVIEYLSQFHKIPPNTHQNGIINGSSSTCFVPNTAALLSATKEAVVVWKSPFGSDRIVYKCSPTIAMKVFGGPDDHVEYHTLCFLEEKKPSIPAPRPKGLFKVGEINVMFMSYLPCQTLSAKWPELQTEQKEALSSQLNDILTDLRTLQQPQDKPLGDVKYHKCQDVRMQVRCSDHEIRSSAAFVDFQFSNPHYGGSSYIKLLRSMIPTADTKIVFTHADIRPDNIMIDTTSTGQNMITGLIDWQYSGFYPEFFEATKITNTMSAVDEDDWYLYLPECVAPHTYPLHWLNDRLWWNHVA